MPVGDVHLEKSDHGITATWFIREIDQQTNQYTRLSIHFDRGRGLLIAALHDFKTIAPDGPGPQRVRLVRGDNASETVLEKPTRCAERRHFDRFLLDTVRYMLRNDNDPRIARFFAYDDCPQAFDAARPSADWRATLKQAFVPTGDLAAI